MKGRNQIDNRTGGGLTVEQIDARIGQLAQALAHRAATASEGDARPVWIRAETLVAWMRPFIGRN